MLGTVEISMICLLGIHRNRIRMVIFLLFNISNINVDGENVFNIKQVKSFFFSQNYQKPKMISESMKRICREKEIKL